MAPMAPSAPAQRRRAVAPERCRHLPPALVDHCLTSPIEIRLNCRVLGHRAPLRIQHRKGYAGSARLVLERFQAKWSPVRVKKTRQIRNLGPVSIPYRNGKGSRPPNKVVRGIFINFV